MSEQVSAAIILSFLSLITINEFYRGDRVLPSVRRWWVRVFLLQSLVLSLMFFGSKALQNQFVHLHLLECSSFLSPFWGGMVSYFVASLFFYWWHRFRHTHAAWRFFHQIHHSPARIQAVTAFYVHPFEALASSALNSIIVLVLLGLPVESLLWNSTVGSLIGIFFHMNLKTPRWIGLFIQRPEMHRYHHEKNEHRRNYSDLPIWDWLFGTYHNPQSFEGECGFEGDRELRLKDMLLFRDVNV